jgi:hypothetical protein
VGTGIGGSHRAPSYQTAGIADARIPAFRSRRGVRHPRGGDARVGEAQHDTVEVDS